MRNLKSIIIVIFVISNIFATSLCETNNLPKDPKILIIGAGPAGIAAASKLYESGFNNVKILEAEDRIGGRVYTTKFGNYSVDLGGQWLHGEEGNVAFELADPLGLVEKNNRPDLGLKEEYYDSAGNRLTPELSKNITSFFIKYVYELDLDDDAKYESVGEYAENMFNDVFKDHPEILNEKDKYFHYMDLLRLSSDSADSWHNISAKDSKLYKTCSGDPIANWKERGYSTILEILTKRYPNPEKELPVLNNTILNTEVTSIDYSNNAEGPSILITTANGQIYKADHIIVTVSLGVLKEKHKSLFIPPLPDYKVAAIEGIGFGSVAKIYLMFDEPFWQIGDERLLIFNFLWNEADKKEIDVNPEKRWLLGMFEAVTVEHKPNLLTMWIAGKHSKEMEKVSEDKVFNHAVEALHRFLDKKYNVTAPVAMLRTRWNSNPHFRGTYSYRSIESHKRKLYPEMLERPLEPDTLALLFAGEATSKDRFSTVDGAIGSGWKAAERLTNHYKKSS